MEGNWYNTYTSIKHSTGGKSLFMAFGSNTGSPCRLRMKSEIASDGRSVVALGSNEKHALFFPVRNISLPDGMNLTSLIQLNKRIPFERNTVKPTGCAPRCSKSSSESIKESSSIAKKIEKPKRKPNACSCLSNETPGQVKAERCKRPRHCKPKHHHRQHHHHHHHNSSGPTNRSQEEAGRQKDKSEATKDSSVLRLTSGSSNFEQTETDWVQHVENNNRPSSSHVSAVDEAESASSARNKARQTSSSNNSNAMTSSKKRTSTQRERERKDKERRKKQPNTEVDNPAPTPEPALVVNRRSKNKPTRPCEGDPTLRLTHKGDSRLIRHMYRKIRAHPELAEELAALL